jgi:uncharacterized protein YjiS (DUF1127 family)
VGKTPANTYFCHISSASLEAGAYLKVTAMLASLIQFIQSWKRYNASLNELSRLGDRELADIGLSRSDIPRAAWENANR